MTIEPSDRRPEWYAVFAFYYAAFAGPHGGAKSGGQESPDVVPIWRTAEVTAAKAVVIADRAQRALERHDAAVTDAARRTVEPPATAPKEKRKR